MGGWVGEGIPAVTAYVRRLLRIGQSVSMVAWTSSRRSPLTAGTGEMGQWLDSVWGYGGVGICWGVLVARSVARGGVSCCGWDFAPII